MKYTRIIIFVLVAALALYWPVSLLFTPAQAAETVEQDNDDVSALPAALQDRNDFLAPSAYTPQNYIPPQYDPFSSRFHADEKFEETVTRALELANTPPEADFSIRTESGVADSKSGTTNTEFQFSAHSSRDGETRGGRLQVRWDFESDGTFDTYFSTRKTARHTYETPGSYIVTLEVLDSGGLISRATKNVMVVENTAPFAHFTFEPSSGTTKQIFTFHTSQSEDSQYKRQHLEYRFDWNGDGQWDTPYKQKTVWRHMFHEAGAYRVVMEAKDPEGATSLAEAVIKVFENRAPTADFFMTIKPVQVKKNVSRDKYFFDASESTDPEGQKLQYRWDFNYTGENDINFTTSWSSSPKYSGFYDFPGEKVVRLQVRDKDGATDDAFVKIRAE